ncbi:MAG: YbhN family protein [Vicinamibacterales bacterium]
MARWLIRAAVSAAVAAVLLAIIPFDAVLDALRRTSPWTWAASVAIFFAGHYLNAMKLRLLLGPVPGQERTVSAACVRAQYAGLVANLGLPGLAGGDLARAAYLAPTVGVGRVAFASVADRMIDTATVLALVAVALPFAGAPAAVAGVVRSAGAWLVVAAAGGGLLALGALVVLFRVQRFAGIAEKVTTAGRALLARKMAFLGAVGISLAVQAAFVMTNVWLARQVGVTTGLAPWFVAWPLSKLIAVLPISLGGIGVREAALVSLLAPYGAPREAVLASGILWQAVLIVTGLVGLVITQMLPWGASVSTPVPAERS